MEEIKEIRDIQTIALGILEYVDKICRENNLQYILVGGTLIGAIRHKGFIPWDDDVDIMMPRPDIDVKFENKNFLAFKNYDTYLTNIYGDYMTPPPEDKRNPHHGLKVYKK